MNLAKRIGVHFIALAICLVVLSQLYALGSIDLSLPFSYAGDSLSGASVMKGISDNGIWWSNPFLGGRGGQFYAEFPFSDTVSFLLIRMIGLFTANVFLIYNLFFFLTFFLVTAASLEALLQMGVHEVPAIACSILYAFIPYHQMRFDHIFLTAYFLVPLTTLVTIWLIRGTLASGVPLTAPDPDGMAGPAGTAWRRSRIRFGAKFWISLAICFLSASTGLYHAFFTCYFLVVAMVIGLINRRSLLESVVLPLTMTASVVAGVLLNLLPSILYLRQHGQAEDPELARRLASDTEIYALKLIQLVLPRSGHRAEALAGITDAYNKLSPHINENVTAALGLVGSAGFIALLLHLFHGRSGQRNRSAATEAPDNADDRAIRLEGQVETLSQLNLAAVLLGTAGGLGALIGYLFQFGMIRGYNRLSIYIGFFALAAVGIHLTRWSQTGHPDSRAAFRQVAVFLACGLILLAGLYDQTVTIFHGPANQTGIRADIESDRRFVDAIEQRLQPGDMVFQLPHFGYPSEGGYEQFKGYFFSEGLVWSFGGMQGRPEDLWARSVEQMPPAAMLQSLRQAGYDGLYVDVTLMENAGSFLTAMTQATGQKPLVSSNSTKAFFPVQPAP